MILILDPISEAIKAVEIAVEVNPRLEIAVGINPGLEIAVVMDEMLPELLLQGASTWLLTKTMKL
jgi:hypothetical protein